MQYVEKSEWPFNIRINKHRDDVLKHDAILASQHFKKCNHNFNEHARFIIIEQLKDQGRSPEIMRRILENREDFWIKKLLTIVPNGLNKGLNRK